MVNRQHGVLACFVNMSLEMFFIDKEGSENLDVLTTDDSIKKDKVKRKKHEKEVEDGDAGNEFSKLLAEFDKPYHELLPVKGSTKQIEKKLDLSKVACGVNLKRKARVDKLLEKCVLQPGYESLHSLPMNITSRRAKAKKSKAERDKTKGANWYHLPATTVTDEIKNDLQLLRMRSVLDPKHVYKKNDITVTPKYFQVGRVIESAAEFYSARIPKSQRKKTIVDELLADSQCRAYQKKKFKEVMDESRRKKGHKAFAMAKKLKNKKNNRK